MTGLPSEHPILGLEAGRWCDMSGWVEAGVHRTELFSTRVFYHDGQPVCYAFLQNGKLVKSVSKKYILQVSYFCITYSFHILSSLFSVTSCRHRWLEDMQQWCCNYFFYLSSFLFISYKSVALCLIIIFSLALLI